MPLSPAAADANTLNSLRPGELFAKFQNSLNVKPTTDVWDHPIRIKHYGRTALISDYLFILRTVYVEAFVGNDDIVDAYTITARTLKMPQGIDILGQKYNFGRTTLANAPLPGGITFVADVCAAHISAYYEISDTAEVDLNETVAVGFTSAGSFPSDYSFSFCDDTKIDSLDLAAGSSASSPQTGLYEIEERFPTAVYIADSLGLRKKTTINAITITAPGYPVIPEMISLHPQEVYQFNH